MGLVTGNENYDWKVLENNAKYKVTINNTIDILQLFEWYNLIIFNLNANLIIRFKIKVF